MWPFTRNKTKEVLVDDLVHTPAATFGVGILTLLQKGVQRVWAQNAEIDEISEEITRLMALRQQHVAARTELVEALNLHRKVLGMEELNDEGEVASDADSADDMNYALEP